MKKVLITASTVALTTVTCLGMAFAQAPMVNISKHRHGNLAAAQSNIVQAYQKINDAQAANNGQLGGHAQRAKDLLAQANVELRLAADVANRNRR